jgi:hypothetical protein
MALDYRIDILQLPIGRVHGAFKQYHSHLPWVDKANAAEIMATMVRSGSYTLDDIRNSGVYRVLTVDEAIPMAREGRLMLHPLMGGLHPDFSWESLERIEKKVLPAL